MCGCEGREHRTSWCPRCDGPARFGHPSDGTMPPPPSNPLSLAVVLIAYSVIAAVVLSAACYGAMNLIGRIT